MKIDLLSSRIRRLAFISSFFLFNELLRVDEFQVIFQLRISGRARGFLLDLDGLSSLAQNASLALMSFLPLMRLPYT